MTLLLSKSSYQTIATLRFVGAVVLVVLVGNHAIAQMPSPEREANERTARPRTMGNRPGKPPGGESRGPIKQSGTFTVDGKMAETSEQSYQSISNDVSAILVANGGELTLVRPTITKSGDTSSEENSSFHGQNAGVLVTRSSRVTVVGGSIAAKGRGANGLFATGSGAVASMSGGSIVADGDAAHGVMASAGGTLDLTNVTITTSQARSAAVATDRGSGTVMVVGGTYTTHGTTSPGIYSTGKISARAAKFTATASEAVVIEGKNSVTLEECDLSGAAKCGAMIYQSFSGDAEGREGTFTMTGGSLAAAQGPLFFVSNTKGNIVLKNVKVSTASGILLDASASRWGRTGSNGGHAVLTAENQSLTGQITADGISSASVILKDRSTLNGALRNASLKLDASSRWVVTADSTLKSFSCADGEKGLARVQGNGRKVSYDPNVADNQWLGGKTHELAGGGSLAPGSVEQ